MKLLGSILLAGLAACSLDGQAIQTQPQGSPQNQIFITPQWLYANKVHYAGTWSATTVYNSQDLVFVGGVAYISLQTANLNNNPAALGLWWVAVPGGSSGNTWGSITGTLGNQADLAAALSGKEPALGNPGTSGYVLSSTTEGVRSWVAQSGGSTGGVLTVTRTDSTDLAIGANCSLLTPCKVRVGTDVFALSAPATVTVSAGTGMAYIWVDSTGTINVGHNLTATCSGATCSSATEFPISAAFPVWSWTATSGTWNVAGGTDWTATYAIDTLLTAGFGITLTPAPGSIDISVDSISVESYLGNPASDGYVLSSTAAGVRSWVAQGGGGGGGGGLSGTCTWSAMEAGTCGSGNLYATMTWAQIEAL